MEQGASVSPFFLVVRPRSARPKPPAALREAVEAAGADFAFEVVAGVDRVAPAMSRALDAGHRRVIVVGPDAAVSQAANVVLSLKDVPDVVLGVVPAGLSRDVAASLGIGSLAAAISAALNGPARRFDAGRIVPEDPAAVSHFVVAASAGWLPPAKGSVPALLRRLPGQSGRLLAGAANLERSSVRTFTLTVDGIEHDGRYRGVSVHNTPRWQSGLLAAPGASQEDGLLDVLRWRDAGRVLLLRNFRAQMLVGAHVPGDAIERSPGRVVELSSPKRTAIFADGRPAGSLPARIEVLPRALSMLVPPA
jgi:diacylglycerol kinase (ATP)